MEKVVPRSQGSKILQSEKLHLKKQDPKTLDLKKQDPETLAQRL